MGWGVRAIWGDRALATPFPTGSYTAADCARWMRNEPQSVDCVTAMTADHTDDFLFNAAESAFFGAVLIQHGNGAGQQFALAFTAALATVFLAFRARRARERPLIPRAG